MNVNGEGFAANNVEAFLSFAAWFPAEGACDVGNICAIDNMTEERKERCESFFWSPSIIENIRLSKKVSCLAVAYIISGQVS